MLIVHIIFSIIIIRWASHVFILQTQAFIPLHNKYSFFPHTFPVTIMSSSSSSTSPLSTTDSIHIQPALPIPPPICSLTPGTWAHDTMSRRVDKEILERTYQENKDTFESPPFTDILKRFHKLRSELQQAGTTPLRHLEPLTHEDERNDVTRIQEMDEWKRILSPFIHDPTESSSSSTTPTDTWLSAPWLVTEFYLYRRLLEALGYFTPGSPGYLFDPFVRQKLAGLQSSIASANHVFEKVELLMPMTLNTDDSSSSSSNLEIPKFFHEGLSLVFILCIHFVLIL